MSFQGRSLGQISQQFADHVNRILNTTVTERRLAVYMIGRNISSIGFQDQLGVSHTLIRTSYGPMELDLRQTCDPVTDEETGLLTLRTTAYRYTVAPEGDPEPLLRWEFVRFPANPDAAWCRHHFQGPIRLGIQNREGDEANLNRRHLPTSGVATEDVLRFCIADLGVQPLIDDWDQQLRL